MERMPRDRKQWRFLVDGLCSQRANRHNEMKMNVINVQATLVVPRKT